MKLCVMWKCFKWTSGDLQASVKRLGIKVDRVGRKVWDWESWKKSVKSGKVCYAKCAGFLIGYFGWSCPGVLVDGLDCLFGVRAADLVLDWWFWTDSIVFGLFRLGCSMQDVKHFGVVQEYRFCDPLNSTSTMLRTSRIRTVWARYLIPLD